MKRIYFTLLFLFLILLFFFAACDDTVVGDELDKIVIPDKEVSYRKYINPVLQAKCAAAGCHEDATRAGGLSVTTYANLTEDRAIVFPYLPESSQLVWSIEGQYGAPVMPPLGATVYPVNANQIKGIKTWIKEGAFNN
ncbi:MAG: c-type cytochrome domain-containing protein [bacterium]